MAAGTPRLSIDMKLHDAPFGNGVWLLAVVDSPTSGGAWRAGPPLPPAIHAAQVELAALTILSPSKATIPYALQELLPGPLSISIPDEVRAQFAPALNHQAGWTTLMRESTWCEVETPAVPRLPGMKRTGVDDFGRPNSVLTPLQLQLPWSCEPELFTRSAEMTPAFNGEIKRVPSIGRPLQWPADSTKSSRRMRLVALPGLSMSSASSFTCTRLTRRPALPRVPRGRRRWSTRSCCSAFSLWRSSSRS